MIVKIYFEFIEGIIPFEILELDKRAERREQS